MNDTNDSNDDDENIAVDVVDEQTEEVTWVESLDHLDMFNLIEKDSFVAIQAHQSSFELFHLMKVEEKQIATENIKDKSEEHCILQGEPYLVGKWFSFQKETKNMRNMLKLVELSKL